MAKSSRKSSFEKDSKAVLETVLNPDAKARVQREMSLTRTQPAPPGKKSRSGTTPGAVTKKASAGKRVTVAELDQRLERFMEEVRNTAGRQRELTETLAAEVQAARQGVQGLEASVRAALSGAEDGGQRLETLAGDLAGLRERLEQVSREPAENPWEAVRSELEDTVREMRERLHRQETRVLVPAVGQPEAGAGKTSPAARTSGAETGDTAALWLARAREYWGGRRFSNPRAAVACLDRALDLEPENAECLNERGLAKSDAGLVRSALADFSRAVELVPTMAAAYHNRGLLYARLNAVEKACRDFQRAAALGDDRAWRLAWKNGYCGGSLFRRLFRGGVMG